MSLPARDSRDAIPFRPAVATYFASTFGAPTAAQALAWPHIVAGESTLLLAPTGSGKTLAAFLAAIDALMHSPEPPKRARCRVLYISPLKALGADVERNLRVPLAGIAEVARGIGASLREITIGVRSGDTSASERQKLVRKPPDILITTPESLYLLLTSNAREILASVDTVIVDEIHSLVPTKRGAHLFLSLERLELLRSSKQPLQRIGLSATQRPLDEVARLLGGFESHPRGDASQRAVAIVDAGRERKWDLRVEVPVVDMADLGAPGSIWPSIHPRLVELIRAHRSTMIFANSRRLAERLATALNETAGEELALAHHGSVARDRRRDIEERLKRGDLKAIVATSSLELGLDLGAVDLVVQIEAPPSIAAGVQRVGRSGHSVGGVARGVIFPKYRGDLLACAAATARMVEGLVEETFYPRCPLDVLAQQIVAIVAMDACDVDALFALVRRAAPFADLPRSSFEGVLDMLSGRYPSDEFAELRPRITWDRAHGRLQARDGARRIAVVNGGTIPDRGLYGVFMAGAPDATLTAKSSTARRVGELDEEMVFESRVGDVFLLGASSWRIVEITHDRVLVRPAPGEPGKMPFWHGDRAGRPVELGRHVGALTRELAAASEDEARGRLEREHGLDASAARNLIAYVGSQARATGEVPSDRAIVIERFVDEVGDQRVCVLTPFGARVHAPWATAAIARCRAAGLGRVEGLWSDDGMVFRLPESESPPDAALFLPPPDEVEDVVLESLGGTSLFAARFRENAARALLLPRRRPGMRSPLWAQRRRAADLLAVAARYGSFPILLETYRECLRDVFDLPALVALLRDIAEGRVRVVSMLTRAPSPFASSLLFAYVASFIYDGDAPLAERRAQALSIDAAELRGLLGEAELRDLLDPEAIRELEQSLQHLDGRRPVATPDALHDLLLAVGDLSEAEIEARGESIESAKTATLSLVAAARAFWFEVAGSRRVAAIEDVARFRDALAIAPPIDAPAALLVPVADPLGDLVSRYARTHGPFDPPSIAVRFGIALASVNAAVDRLTRQGRIVLGEFTPGRSGQEACDAGVLRSLKRRSLAKLRREVEPVAPHVLGRFLLEWQGVRRPRGGLDPLLAVIEQLEGAPIPASVLESEVLPARIVGYHAADLDILAAAGEIVWCGLESLGARDGRVALFLTDQAPLLAPISPAAEGDLVDRIRLLLAERGALFFGDIVGETAAFAPEVLAAIWDLVWAGEVTNDTLAPLRSRLRGTEKKDRRPRPGAFRSRRAAPPGAEGRWSLLRRTKVGSSPSETERRAALVRALLDRHGVLTREAVAAEGIEGGFTAVYEVLKAMEDAGRVRRGYFVAGLGATQFALPGADDRLRALREEEGDERAIVLAATDPANPWGAALAWPESAAGTMQRAAGAQVVLDRGALIGYLGRAERALTTFLPVEEIARGQAAETLARALADLVDSGRRRVLLLGTIDNSPAGSSSIAKALLACGFVRSREGLLKQPPR